MVDSTNEPIKVQRVKSFFIQATKEIILNEGLDNATVRYISKKAGYAVSTFYQYFGQLNNLFVEVKKTCINDLMSEIQKHVVIGSQDVEDIKAQNHAFLDFFIKNPNVYPFFYMQFDTTNSYGYDHLVFTDDYYSIYEPFIETGMLRKEDIPTIARIIVYSMNGMLRIYFSNKGLSAEDVHNDLDRVIDYLFSKEAPK